ncbi:MAG: hypothetical protein ACI861_000269 [Paracoccaceae bacterium]|jgi:uncharacterized protein (DUF1800 family)
MFAQYLIDRLQMTQFTSTLAAIRYGYGLSPHILPPNSTDEMLAKLIGPDEIAERLPIVGFTIRAEEEAAMGLLRRAKRNDEDGAQEALKAANKVAIVQQLHELRASLLRPAVAKDAFRERLVRFWADHFTVAAKGKGLRHVTTGYIEDAIRPHVTGSFSALLRKASTHPAMLVFLDQIQSVGPNSKIGKKLGRGLNENLAREILELHTLGVGGAYSQVDVRQFAELLTGLYYNYRKGFSFRPRAAEPGAETVLGHSYGGRSGELDDIYQVLDDLAHHPDTARHIARKLVVHFVSDEPDPRLVDHVTAAYIASQGDLRAVYAALLEHPIAWENPGVKAKRPFEFMASSLRALGVSSGDLDGMAIRKSRLYFTAPLQVMGQPWLQPAGPDGWPEALADWITPQGLAARIQWALLAAGLWSGRTEPVDFANIALGEMADARLRRLVGFAESRVEGIALVLASPEFNRR